MNDNEYYTMDDWWRCNYLFRPRNLSLRSRLYYVTIFVSVAVVLILVLRETDRHKLQQLDNRHRNVLVGTSPTRNKIHHTSQHQQPSIILYWTKFFGTNDFEVGLGSKPFASCTIGADDVNASSCCLTTTDRGLLNDSDAVIFHGRDLHVEDLPPPGWRRPHQMFVFFLLESPVHTDLEFLQRPVFRNYFNRTMTYRRDSDVVELHAYGRLRCIDPSSPSCLQFPRYGINADSASVLGVIEKHPAADSAAVVLSDMNNVTISSSKNRTVAWFVSNCNSNSQRESVVRRLSQFIAVDIYGKCGNGSNQHSCPNKFECDQMLSRHYRFYLSFENSLCPDYITEKLYRPLAHDTVPVVYGGSDYSLYLPAGSYVNARDFENPEALANHLKKLMANDTLYASYFQWRSQYVVDAAPLDGWCHLCRLLQLMMLRDPLANEEKTILDVAAWWSGQTTNQTCSSPPKSLIIV
ncbi:alpha-(1,3)-fucosyltransferase C-like [Daphnia pulicaria]|jgi:alpha-1,3-fucosyltransferase|uniref:alpha-(1,3)-fucosyltransferase C-like n=1 Tax=Daphnia pulicaria TaxID=35523 RepID=UPI001EECA122|nr:alpha-(1,3)-fucosyltransferase C-like [Daphnia pulicaria]